MNILIANDDGIDSEGLLALVDALKDDYDLYVAAPSSQRSAFSHSVTYFYKHNRAKRMDIPGTKAAYAIDGTPADCTYYGLNGLFDETMDLVVSGINVGRNMASDVIYSGTVAAAGEALIAHTPAIAVSLCSYQGGDFTASAKAVKKVIPLYMNNSMRSDFLLNINVPCLMEEEIKGMLVTDLHDHVDYGRPVEKIEKDGALYLKIDNDDMKESRSTRNRISDVEAVAAGYIALTPLYYDMCARQAFDLLEIMEEKRL